jgi:hypothetical protein
MVTVNLNRKKDSKAIMPLEFFPWIEQQKNAADELVGQTPEEISTQLKALLGRVD